MNRRTIGRIKARFVDAIPVVRSPTATATPSPHGKPELQLRHSSDSQLGSDTAEEPVNDGPHELAHNALAGVTSARDLQPRTKQPGGTYAALTGTKSDDVSVSGVVAGRRLWASVDQRSCERRVRSGTSGRYRRSIESGAHREDAVDSHRRIRPVPDHSAPSR